MLLLYHKLEIARSVTFDIMLSRASHSVTLCFLLKLANAHAAGIKIVTIPYYEYLGNLFAVNVASFLWRQRLIFVCDRYLVLHALCWSRQHQTSLPFLFSYYLTLVLFSPPCPLLHLSFYLKLCGRSGRNCLLSPVLSDYNGSPDTRFPRGTTRLMSWPDGERYLRAPQSLVVSLFLSLVSTLVFSRTGGVMSHLNSLTHRFPRLPPRNLCFLVMLTVFSLVYAATDTAF